MPFQSKLLNTNLTINCGGRLLDFSTPKVMGILNATPDSFFAQSRALIIDDALNRVATMISEGAAIIDVGGQSTRPGAHRVKAEEEWDRLKELLPTLHSTFGSNTVFSIDTFYSNVAERALDCGFTMINDVSAGSIDEKIMAVAVKYKIPYVVMHMLGDPSNMQRQPHYKNVVYQVLEFLRIRIEQIRALDGGKEVDLIVDPGFGFGKTVDHNYSLLKHLDAFRILSCPIMVGVSRKSMVNKVLNISPEEAANGTTAVHMLALLKGDHILRVHDVRAAQEAIKIWKQFETVN